MNERFHKSDSKQNLSQNSQSLSHKSQNKKELNNDAQKNDQVPVNQITIKPNNNKPIKKKNGQFEPNMIAIENAMSMVSDPYDSQQIDDIVQTMSTVEEKIILIDKIMSRQEEIQQLQMDIRLNNQRPLAKIFVDKASKKIESKQLPASPQQFKQQHLQQRKFEQKNKERLKFKRQTILRFEAHHLVQDKLDDPSPNTREKASSIQVDESSLNSPLKGVLKKRLMSLSEPSALSFGAFNLTKKKSQENITDSNEKKIDIIEEEENVDAQKQSQMNEQQQSQGDYEEKNRSKILNVISRFSVSSTPRNAKQKQKISNQDNDQNQNQNTTEDLYLQRNRKQGVNTLVLQQKKDISDVDYVKAIENAVKSKINSSEDRMAESKQSELDQEKITPRKLNYSKTTITRPNNYSGNMTGSQMFAKKAPLVVLKDLFPQNRMKKIRIQNQQKQKNMPEIQNAQEVNDLVAYELYNTICNIKESPTDQATQLQNNSNNGTMVGFSKTDRDKAAKRVLQQKVNLQPEEKVMESVIWSIDRVADKQLRKLEAMQIAKQVEKKQKNYLANSFMFLEETQAKKEQKFKQNKSTLADPFQMLSLDKFYRANEDSLKSYDDDANNAGSKNSFLQKLKSLQKNHSQNKKTCHLLFSSDQDVYKKKQDSVFVLPQITQLSRKVNVAKQQSHSHSSNKKQQLKMITQTVSEDQLEQNQATQAIKHKLRQQKNSKKKKVITEAEQQEDSFISIYEMRLTGLYKENQEIAKLLVALDEAELREENKTKRNTYLRAIMRQQQNFDVNQLQLNEIIYSKIFDQKIS